MTAPPVPPPDDKDWTWVLHRPCPECGYDAESMPFEQVPAAVESVVAAFADRLTRPDADRRPEPDVWSPAEYACHVRDVCRIFTVRLHRLLTEDDPVFANWD